MIGGNIIECCQLEVILSNGTLLETTSLGGMLFEVSLLDGTSL